MGVPKNLNSKTPKVSKTKVSNPVESSSNKFFFFVVALVLVAVVIFGFIIVSGNKQKEERLAAGAEAISGINMNFDKENAKITLTTDDEVTTADTQTITLYEDFTCLHCGELAISTDDKMLEEISAGKLNVEIASMTFMDGNSKGVSHELLAAVLAAADSGDKTLYWNLRKTFLEEQFEYAGKTRDAYAELAQAYGAEDEVVSAIKDGEYFDLAAEIGEFNENELSDRNNGEVGTPLVFIGDTRYHAAEWTEYLNAM